MNGQLIIEQMTTHAGSALIRCSMSAVEVGATVEGGTGVVVETGEVVMVRAGMDLARRVREGLYLLRVDAAGGNES